MKKSKCAAILLAAAVLTGSACSNSDAPSVSFMSPGVVGPSSGSSYRFKDQPVTLTITNAVRTAPAIATYSVEVATDAAFANKVFSRDGIAEGSGGTTSLTVPALAAAAGPATYYWRSTTTIDGFASPPSAARSFVVQQQVIINIPTLLEPASGSTTDARPRFVTSNAARQGPAGAITYDFQVSRVADFSSLLFTAQVGEQSGGQTAWTPAGDLPTGTVYWRVRARDDANAEATVFTSPRSVTIELFDPGRAIFWNNPPGIAGWPETARITSVDFSTGHMLVDFTRRIGPNAWPENASHAFGPIQYTLGMCFRIDGQWHCSAPTRFWIGRDLENSGRQSEILSTWFYDPVRWGPMTRHVPAPGELVAFWVGQGNLRADTIATNQERSNFALVRWGENYRAN